MGYQWVSSGIFAAIGVVALIVAFLMLVRKNWLLGWIKGSIGLVFLAVAVIMGLAAFNVNGYRAMVRETPVATVSFDQIDTQLYKARVVLAGSDQELPFEVFGDLWQIDARVIKWKGLLARISKPGYKLGRLQGRYITMEDESEKARSSYNLSKPDVGFDLWSAVDKVSGTLDWLDAEYASVTFLPMADGALFAVHLTHTGLIAHPENSRAELAVKDWE